MPRPEIERRVFVVGVPRSGTTLVQSLLAAHSRVTSFTESHLFARHFKLVTAASALLVRDPMPRVGEFLAENGLEATAAAERVRRAVPPAPFLPFRTRSVARQLLRLLDDMAGLRARSIWVEKTPRHLRFVPFLERLSEPVGRSRFVHVVRDGLEVVASLRTASRSWERAYDLDRCVERWNADVEFSLGRVGRPHDHFVVYEELTARPEAALGRLLAALDLEWEPEILESFADASARLITPRESWKGGAGRGLRPSATSGHALTDAERERATAALRRDLYSRVVESTAP